MRVTGGLGAPREFFGRVARTVTERPLATIAVVAALAVIGAALAFQLEASTSVDSLVGRSSSAAAATDRFHRQFGDEAIVVLVKGPLERTVLTPDLGRLIGLEGCLAGNVPKAAEQLLAKMPKPCRALAKLKPAKVVYGPGTFVNTAADQIDQGFAAQQAAAAAQGQQAAAAAAQLAAKKGYSKKQQAKFAADAIKLAQSNFQRTTLLLALRYGLTSVPSVDNPSFVSQLVFDPAAGVNQPKARFAYLFPSSKAAMIQIRLRPDLSQAQRNRAIDLVEQAVGEKAYKLQNGQKYVVTGIPVVTRGLADAVQTSVFVMLGAALLVMAGTLLLVFRSTRRRVRLLPLALALAAAAISYGAVYLAGLDLTMASIAALPVLIGLAVDYAIQLQARFDEGLARGRAPREAAWTAATTGAPTIAGAGLATAAGFLVLLLSPIPMVHGFAILVIVGIVLALACALTAGLAALSHLAEQPERPAAAWRMPALPRLPRPHRVRRGRRPEDLPPALPRTRAWLARSAAWLAPRRRAGQAMRYSVAEPRRVLAVALLLAVLGWAADTQLGFESDIRKLVPQDLTALRNANDLQQVTGVSGELDVTIHGKNLLAPQTIAWMTSFQSRALAAHGYKVGKRCNDPRNAPDLCPALSLTDLFRNGAPGQQVDARQLLTAVPAYFRQAVVTPDEQTATLAFGIRLMPLERQEKLVNDLRAMLKPPPGVTAQLAGLPVLAADANAALSSEWRRVLTIVAALAAVFLVLLAIRRRAALAAVPLIPIALATGWSSLLLFIFGVQLNPMTATLGALVIAISTEFAVLLSARYQQEREAGSTPERALELTYASTGAAVLASGATAIAGFAAVIASNITMLREFGVVTVVDLTVSLLGVMVVLPAALLWAERHGPFSLADLDPRPLASVARRGIRSAPAALKWRPIPRRERA